MKIHKDTREDIEQSLSKTFLKKVSLETLYGIYKGDTKASDIPREQVPKGMTNDFFNLAVKWALTPYGFDINRCFKEAPKNTGAALNFENIKKLRNSLESMKTEKQNLLVKAVGKINELKKTKLRQIEKLEQLEVAVILDALNRN